MRYSIEAEQSVIGGLMLNNNAFDDVSHIVTVDDFFNADCRDIYRAMVSLAEKSLPMDVVSIGDALEAEGILQQVGGFAFLVEVANNTPSAANIETYAHIVRERAVERKILAAAASIQECVMGNGSADDKLDFARSAVSDLDSNNPVESVDFKQLVKSELQDIDARFRGNVSDGLKTGFAAIDERFGGIEPADLWILAARPSMGKTTLALNIADKVASTGAEVIIFSLEVSKEQIAKKMMSAASGIPYGLLRSGKLVDHHWHNLSSGTARLANQKIHVIDIAGLDIDRAISIARKYSRKSKISLVIFDYLQLITAKTDGGRFDEISYISRRLKVLAKTVNCPVLALSQLSRKCEERSNKRPINSDLRESGQIEQDADIISFIYRDEVYNKDSPEKGIAELITSKFRNGECGTDRLFARLDQSRFEDITGDYRPPEYSREPERKRLY